MNNAWESFTTQLQQFDAHLEEQKTQLGGILVKQLDEFRCGEGGRGSEERRGRGGIMWRAVVGGEGVAGVRMKG